MPYRLICPLWCLVALITFAGCDRTGNDTAAVGGVDLCSDPNPPEPCGQACVKDGDCGSGFHCTGASICNAECSGAEMQHCGDTEICSDRGLCIAGPDAPVGPAPVDCPNVSVNLEPVIPTVIFLVDGSGSMAESFGNTNRWNAVLAALTTPGNGVVHQLDDRVRFGATIYHSVGGNAGGQCPRLFSQAAAMDNGTAIAGLLNGFTPEADTPTAESMAALAANFPAADGPRIILLATDGNPDTCLDSNDHSPSSQAKSEQATQAAYALGIETYVLSVGDDVTLSHLQRLANAGRGQPLATGTEPYYVANNPAQLVQSFNQIIRGARACEFTLDQAVTSSQAYNGTVTLNGQMLTFNTDFRLKDPVTIELLGGACDTFLDTDSVTMSAVFPCDYIIE